MTRPALKALSVTAFRGAIEPFSLNFRADSRLTMIYGENGSGKTTLCDAFEFLAKGRVGSLDNRGMGPGVEKFYPAAGKTPADLLVRLDSSGGACEGRLAGRAVAVSPEGSEPRLELLRQRQITDLVEARPRDRYEAISRFIDIAEFEASEKALSDLLRASEAEEQEASRAERQSLETLHGFYEAADSPAEHNPLSWAKAKLSEVPKDQTAEIAALGKLNAAFDRLNAFPEELNAREELIGGAQAAEQAAQEAYNTAAAAVTAGATDLLGVLKAGQNYLTRHPHPSECPLCGSAENAEALPDTVPARIAELNALDKASDELKAARSALERAKDSLADTSARYLTAASAFNTDLKEAASIVSRVDAGPDDVASLPAWLESMKSLRESWARTINEWSENREFVEALRIAAEQYELNLRRNQELNAIKTNASQALEICQKERKAFTDAILQSIAGKVGELYEKVHPGEGLNKISLPLDPNRRASLNLSAQFGGSEAPPQAYFSQSHLDTLGLCVFLALALRGSSAETVLILDDVLGSVDEPHVDRVISLIYDVADEFQHTIVTTHYRPWKEKFRWGRLKPDQPLHFIELRTWSMARGITVGDIVHEIDFLKRYLSAVPIDPQTICSKAGVILEAILDYLALKYQCALPRKSDNRYTLGELLPTVASRLGAALEVAEVTAGAEGPRTSLKPIFDTLTRIASARNAMGAHFNEIGLHLPEADAVNFATEVAQLYDLLVHPDHGWPDNRNSGSYWRNRKDSRRLYPLEKPR